jgi:2-deoxy-D-gluconate 3-dehydrogenase
MTVTMAEAGADIVAILSPWDKSESELEQAVQDLGHEFKVFKCNVADSVALRACFRAIWDAGITPDILFNCSILNRRGPIGEMTDEDIDLVSKVSLMSTYAPR